MKQYCTFFIDKLLYGIDVMHVQEVIRHRIMSKVPLAKSQIKGLLNLRGQIVPTFDLRTSFGLSGCENIDDQINLIVFTNDGIISLLADDIGDVITVDDEEFEPVPESVDEKAKELFTGVYKLKNRLLTIVNLTTLINQKIKNHTEVK